MIASAPTAQAPHWAAEFDRKLNERFAGETQRHQLAALAQPGQSDEAYRNALKVCDKADAELAAMQAHMAELQDRIDSAAAQHAEVCGRIQERLAAEDVPAAERVALRVQINDQNSKLEAVTAEVRPLLEAADKEFQLLRVRAGVRQQIENAFCAGGTEEQQTRLKILRRTGDLLYHGVGFALGKKAGATDDPITAGVLDLYHKLISPIGDEQREIRQSRLRELYGTTT